MLTLLYNVELFNPKTIDDRGSSFYTNEAYLKWDISKISDEYLPRNFAKPKSQSELRASQFDIVKGEGVIRPLTDRTHENKAKVEMIEDGTIRANVAYFPAWKIYVDGNVTSYIVKEDGLYLNLPSGEYEVTTKFVQTPIEKAANTLSLVGLLGIIIVIIPYGKKAS